MELSSSNIKKIIIFSQKKKSFSYIFSKERKIKEIHPRKISYTPGNGNPRKIFLYFLKRRLFLHFGKPKPRNGNSKKTYISSRDDNDDERVM